ncbi:thermonuclease family protein [Chamaesiphon sp. GL140_3_metabinner_50]|uniref:thermonuclease family protein n=1 Tax=Chamaesiphon sp. GL140_3_metabinner_50 TaxID=2970812 RepID=UPI0025F51A6E|nr:thermonuclease family protein [Chamaesiphon sp. GL140_3_metabinner_50]
MNCGLRSWRWWQICGLLLLLVGCQTAPPNYPTIQVSRVISGQSIEWTDKSQQPPVIQQGRLIGIEAPDLAQEPWGKQAKQRLEELVGLPEKNAVSVEFEGEEADKYGRRFVYLWKDGRLLNEQLLRDGCVLVSRSTSSLANNPSVNKYRERSIRGSQYARLMGVGIWNPERPMRMSPSEFRKEER